nr:hypothetical protein [Tanacetum cinerariifolium]
MNESAKRHKNSNLIKEIQAFIDAAIRNQRASIKALEIQIGQMRKVLQERGSGSLPSSTETNPRDHVNSISTTVETDTTPIHRIESTQYVVSTQQNSKLVFKPRQSTILFPSHLYDDCCDEKKGSYRLKDLDTYSIETTLRNDSLPKKEKDPGSFTLPCYINNVCFEKALADLGASISVIPLSTYLNLGLGELAHTKLTVELAYMTVKHPKGIAKNVLVGIAKRHKNSNLIKEIQASIDAAIRNQGASIKALEIQIGQMRKVLQERGSGSLPSSTETNPRDHVNLISTTVETDTTPIHRIESTQYIVSTQQNSKLVFKPRQSTILFPSHLYDDCCDEKKGSYRLKYLDTYSIETTLRNDSLPKKEKTHEVSLYPAILIMFVLKKPLLN